MSPAEELRYLVLALQREGNRQLSEMLRPLELTPSQAEVLQVLDQFGQLSLADLGARLVCETGSPSRLVKGLVQLGYITKLTDNRDGRAVNLSLTEKGHAVMIDLNAIEGAYNQEVAKLSKSLPIPIEEALELLQLLVEGTAAGEAIKLRKKAKK